MLAVMLLKHHGIRSASHFHSWHAASEQLSLKVGMVHAYWLLPAGLSLLNLSLDTLRPERFERMTRRQGHDRVLETLDLALTLGFDPVKVSFLRTATEHGRYASTSLWAS